MKEDILFYYDQHSNVCIIKIRYTKFLEQHLWGFYTCFNHLDLSYCLIIIALGKNDYSVVKGPPLEKTFLFPTDFNQTFRKCISYSDMFVKKIWAFYRKAFLHFPKFRETIWLFFPGVFGTQFCS